MVKSKIKPPHLAKGDTIGIVAPASSFDADNFRRGIVKLRKLGYKVKYERAIFSKYWSRSGHDCKRAEQINRMFSDESVKAIFCAKAGYGSVEIIPYLDKKCIESNPKIFVGYSDITILLLYLQRIANMVVFHGPVVSGEIYEGMNQGTLDYLLRVVTNPQALGELRFSSLKVFKPGRAKGSLAGGNMSLIVQAMGTPYEIDTKDSILFLEDVSENLADIHKYLLFLQKEKKFEKVKGLVFGKMVDCWDDPMKENKFKKLINKVFCDYDIPVLFGFPSGHVEKKAELRVTLPLGVAVSLDSGELSVKIEEAGVS
ncbi:MAG: LD-carboxypeptidase [Candidatus Omnitrophica bacterium]|nr:LD-carboxypeptidase [Candidatus Omnitrophota bacterium]MDD5429505.1 LD-carboxypeptidase [Candidatus Omnitrophota bacterium]